MLMSIHQAVLGGDERCTNSRVIFEHAKPDLVRYACYRQVDLLVRPRELKLGY
jgi:hypothetical protein